LNSSSRNNVLVTLRIGTIERRRRFAPQPLLVPTLGDRLRAEDPQSRTVAIGGKDRAAMILSGGKNAYLTLWWSGETGLAGRGELVELGDDVRGRNVGGCLGFIEDGRG
jgi:hypothetical protein